MIVKHTLSLNHKCILLCIQGKHFPMLQCQDDQIRNDYFLNIILYIYTRELSIFSESYLLNTIQIYPHIILTIIFFPIQFIQNMLIQKTLACQEIKYVYTYVRDIQTDNDIPFDITLLSLRLSNITSQIYRQNTFLMVHWYLYNPSIL